MDLLESDMNMNKVMIIINGLGYGGAETQTISLANGLAEAGYDILLICLFDVHSLKDRLDNRIQFTCLYNKKYFDRFAFKKLHDLCCSFNPCLFLVVDLYPLLYSYLILKVLRYSGNSIVVLHNTLPKGKKEALQNRYYKYMINAMDKIVFVSWNQKKYWMTKYGLRDIKTAVIHNGVDLDFYGQYIGHHEDIRRKLGWADNQTVIAMNTCLRPEKRHEDMIAALRMLRDDGYECKLLIIGDGIQREALTKCILANGLTEHVFITGYVEDVRPFLACGDISVLTSVAVETLSMAAIESMAMGKPLVLSNIGGASELVEKGVNGFLFPPGDIDALSTCIRRIIDENLVGIMGKASKEKARSSFSLEKMVDQYLRILSEIKQVHTKVSDLNPEKENIFREV